MNSNQIASAEGLLLCRGFAPEQQDREPKKRSAKCIFSFFPPYRLIMTTRSMYTGVAGCDLSPILFTKVGVWPIFCTVSSPPITLPNTVYLPSSCCVPLRDKLIGILDIWDRNFDFVVVKKSRRSSSVKRPILHFQNAKPYPAPLSLLTCRTLANQHLKIK